MSGKSEDVSIIKRMERDRRGKPIMSLEARIRMLEEIYDGALFWLRQAVMSAKGLGTGAATIVLERTRLEIIDLKRTAKLSGNVVGIETIGWEITTDDTALDAMFAADTDVNA